jgi:hypothetical protein
MFRAKYLSSSSFGFLKKKIFKFLLYAYYVQGELKIKTNWQNYNLRTKIARPDKQKVTSQFYDKKSQSINIDPSVKLLALISEYSGGQNEKVG